MTTKKRIKEFSSEDLNTIEKLASMLTNDQIANFFGIGKTKFYQLLQKQPEARMRIDKGQAKAIVSIAGNLIQKAQSGDKACMMFYLKTRAGWKETQQIDHTSSDETFKQKSVKISDAQINSIIERLKNDY